jgi:predicted Zn-dependent protease
MRFPGHYTDGRTAQRHEVDVQPGRTALTITEREGALLAQLPYDGLYAAEEVYGAETPVRLRHRERGEATLTLAGAGLLREIEAQGGRRLRGHGRLRPGWALAALALGLAAAALVAGALWLPRLLAPLAQWVPARWEQALGERIVTQLATEYPLCTAPAGRQALTALSERLGAQTALPYPLRVHVVRSDSVNAFAMPGGQIVVLQGLLQAAHTPEEVAGVLAHEIGHVERHHPMRGLIRATSVALLVQALTGGGASLDAAAARFGQTLVLTSYTRQDESEADRFAVSLLQRAGIRATGLAEFLRRSAAQEPRPGALPALLATHPLSADRIAQIEAAARVTGPHGSAALAPALLPEQWQALRRICQR